ncbi:MAG: putative metal-dependent hydrolase [Bacteroidetes bacterium]|nr:putative metal-dependent hydrolase [Bacteroidota bacterium]
MDLLKYPIGKFIFPEIITLNDIKKYENEIRKLPVELSSAVNNLDEVQLNTPYREGGWSVRQLVHHIADSHMNGYIRVKWGLTEDEPLIKTYDQDEWVKLPDTFNTPVSVSLNLISELHERWANLISVLNSEQISKKIKHPENSYGSLDQVICLYAWHGKHHTAHISSLIKRMNW